jgi:hypothetical protein
VPDGGGGALPFAALWLDMVAPQDEEQAAHIHIRLECGVPRPHSRPSASCTRETALRAAPAGSTAKAWLTMSTSCADGA